MARLLGPDASARMAYTTGPSGILLSARGLTATVYADPAGTVLADIASWDPADPDVVGPPIAGSVVHVDAYSMLPLFWFPEGSRRVWVTASGGPLTPAFVDVDGALAAEAETRTEAVTAVSSAAAADTARVRSLSPIVAADYGTTKNLTALTAALDAAEARGRGSVVYVDGVWDVGDGLSMAGRSSLLRGRNGSAGTNSAPAGSVIYASTQTGPVVDFTGWVPPNPTFMKKVTLLEGVQIRGSGVADPTKVRSGVKLSSLSSATVRDVSIESTGGPCLELASVPGNGVYLCDFERVVLNRPIGCDTNDVPFFVANESNGNRFRSIGLMIPQGHSTGIGVSGAVIVEDNATYAGHDMLFDGWWFENLQVPTGGTIFNFKGNQSVIRDMQFFDIRKAVGATGTSYFRFRPVTGNPVVNFGGNLLMGAIPGKDTGAQSVDMGVDMQQSRNRVWGTKGYKGTNVVIASGVTNTDVDLGGAVATATDPAVVDNSGGFTTTVVDRYSRIEDRGTYTTEPSATLALGPGPRFYDPATPANGGVLLGTSNVRWQSIGTSMYGSGDNYLLRKLDGTAAPLYLGGSTSEPSIRQGTGNPEGVVSAAPGSLFLRKDASANTALYLKETGSGNAGWVAVFIPSGGSGGMLNGTGTRKIISGAYYGGGPHIAVNTATTLNRMSAMPLWVPETFTAVSIECEVTSAAASSTMRLGIYAPASTDKPGALVLDAGSVDSSTAGVKAVAISQVLDPGLYWLTAVPQGGVPTVRTLQGSLPPAAPTAFNAGAVNGYYTDAVSGAMPTPFGSATPFTTATKVMVKAA